MSARPELAPEDRLLTPAEVSARFRCDAKSVTRWANQGKIGFVRTLGGHRRYYESEVNRLLAEGTVHATVRVLPAREGGAA